MSSSNPTPSKITSLQLSSDVYDQLKRYFKLDLA